MAILLHTGGVAESASRSFPPAELAAQSGLDARDPELSLHFGILGGNDGKNRAASHVHEELLYRLSTNQK